MEQKRVRIRRKRRKFNRKNVFVILAAITLIMFPPLFIYVINTMYPAAAQQIVQTSRHPEAPATSGQPVEAEPETANSEIAGKWYGLCAKNSITSIDDFQRTVNDDPVLAEHFADFDWENASVGYLGEAIWRSVSYRKNDVISQTKKKIRLPAGDPYITDGIRHVRTYCCNDYTIQPPPAEAHLETEMEKIDGSVHRREVVAGPPVQQSANAPGQISSGPPPRRVALAPAPTPSITPQLIRIPNVPEPGTFLLVGTGLAGMVLVHTIRRKK